jgi:hypothetical protein
MEKIKCSKCGYLNPAEELMCGMCGEIFKKEKSSLGGKVVEEAPPAKTKKKRKTATVEEEPAAPKTKAKAKPAAAEEPELIESPAAEPAPAAAPPTADIRSALRNFLQTEEFRQAVALVAREAAPPAKAPPPPITPEELKSLVEKKIDQALPNFLQTEAVLGLVREEVEKMPRPEAEAPAISDKELEEKVGEILAKSAGREGGGSLTMEAVELKVNAMIADIREKLAGLSSDEKTPSLEEISKIVDNLVKVSLEEARSGNGNGLTEEQVVTIVEGKITQALATGISSTDDLENTIFDRVRKFIEEQGTQPIPEASVDYEKIQAFIEGKIAEVKPVQDAGAASDPAALKKEIQTALDSRFNSTEFSLLMMHMVQDAMPKDAASGGDTAAGMSDEVLAAKIGDILKDPAYQEILPKPAEGGSGEPQLTARDVERIVNTRYQVLESDLIGSELFKKAVMRAVQKATSSVMGAAVTPELMQEELGKAVDSLRDEVREMLSTSLLEHLDSDEFGEKIRSVAAAEAAGAIPDAPSIDMSEIDQKISQSQNDIDAKVGEALKPLKEKIEGVSALIAQEVETHWQEKLSSEEIVAKISEVARQIAEGTVEARPALTKEDISKAWDEKFASEEAQAKLREMATEIAQAAVAAIPEPPAIDMSEIEEKVSGVRSELETRLAETLQPMEERVGSLSAAIAEAVEAHWREKLSSEEIVEKISEVARQIAEGTMDAHPALTREDISKAWDEKFISEETQAKLQEIAAAITQAAIAAHPELTQEDVSRTLDEKFASEEMQASIRALAAQEAARVMPEAPSVDMSEIDEKISQVQSELTARLAETIAPVESEISGIPAVIEKSVETHWQEKLSSEEIVAKISEVARQIAEGTIEARPALTKEDISKAWDEKFASEEAQERIRETAAQIADEGVEAHVSAVREEVTRLLEEKLARVTGEIEGKTADSLGVLEDQLMELNDSLGDKLARHWQEKLDSADMVDRITEVAGQVTEKMLGARASLTTEDVQAEIGKAVEETVSPLIENTQQKAMPGILEKVSTLITSSIRSALKEHLQSEEFGKVVGQVADKSATQALEAQPRLTPDNVREIAGGQFDHWIETYFKSEDFKEKVTEHIRKVAVDMLRDARTVILEDAEMRTGEQIESRLATLEFVSPSALSERLNSLQTEIGDKLKGLEEGLAAAAEDKTADKLDEVEKKLNEIVTAFEADLKPLKEQLDRLSGETDTKLKPLYDEFKELSAQVEKKFPDLESGLAQFQKKLPGLETELAQFVKNSAASAVSAEQKLKSLANQLATTKDEMEKEFDSTLAEKLENMKAETKAAREAFEKDLKKMTERISSITPTDPESIERMIKAKVGDLPRQVEVFQKRLASLAEETLSGGGGGGGGGIGQDEIAALVLAEVELNIKKLLESPEFKKAVVACAPAGGEGGGAGVDKEELEQGLRAFVQLETGRVTQTLKDMLAKTFESDQFAEKVRTIAAASIPAGGGGEGGGSGLSAEQINTLVMEGVKKALDTKEVNLKIAQKFLEVMSYVKSEVPKIVAAALKKQGG